MIAAASNVVVQRLTLEEYAVICYHHCPRGNQRQKFSGISENSGKQWRPWGMSFFDQPYYALTKTYMSRIGLWPEQSKHARIIRPLAMLTISLTLLVPAVAIVIWLWWSLSKHSFFLTIYYVRQLIRIHDARRDINIITRNVTMVLIGTGIFIITFSCIQNFDKVWF